MSPTITNGCVASTSVPAGQADRHKWLLPPTACYSWVQWPPSYGWGNIPLLLPATSKQLELTHGATELGGMQAVMSSVAFLGWMRHHAAFWVLLERIWAELKPRLTSISSTRSTWDCFTCCLDTWSVSWNLQRR